MKGYIDWEKKEAGIFEDRLWKDRYLINEYSLIGGVYRMRIIRPLPGLQGFVLEGPDGEEILLRDKDTLEERKSGQVVLVQIVKDGYEGKMPMASEKLPLKKSDPLWEDLKQQLHFDPVPAKLMNLDRPLLSWMHYYQGIEWLTNDKKAVLAYAEESGREVDWSLFHLIEEKDFSVDYHPIISPQRRYWLSREISNDYAEIVVDQAEAACFIDVNQTGRGMHLPAKTKAQVVNEKSIPLLVGAIKLQALQGIVIIDPISMSKKDGSAYIKALKDAIYKAYLPADVLGYTRAGLVEVLVRRS